MWHSDDRFFTVLNGIATEKSKSFPQMCPICDNCSVHLFFINFNRMRTGAVHGFGAVNVMHTAMHPASAEMVEKYE